MTLKGTLGLGYILTLPFANLLYTAINEYVAATYLVIFLLSILAYCRV